MFYQKSKKYIFVIMLIVVSLVSFSCSWLRKKEKMPVRYGAIDAQINSCLEGYNRTHATLSLEKYFNHNFDTSFTENDIDTTFELLEIVSDSMGHCTYDSLTPGYYKAIARGGSYNVFPNMSPLLKGVYPNKGCGPVRIVNIRIGADSTSFLDVDLPGGKWEWNYYRHYYKKTIMWEENIRPIISKGGYYE